MKTITWLSNNQGQYLIENIWNILKQNSDNKRSTNVMELHQAIKKNWDEISADEYQKFVDSICHVEAIFQSKVGAIKY